MKDTAASVRLRIYLFALTNANNSQPSRYIYILVHVFLPYIRTFGTPNQSLLYDPWYNYISAHTDSPYVSIFKGLVWSLHSLLS